MILSSDFRRVTAAGPPQVRVEMEGYKRSMLNEMHSLQQYLEERAEKLSNINMSLPVLEKIAEDLKEYPRIGLIIRLINDRDKEALSREFEGLWEWYRNSGRSLDSRGSVMLIMDFMESLGDISQGYSPDRAEERFNEVVSQTEQNMEKIEHIVRDAIARVPFWHGYPVVIKARARQSDMLRDRNDFAPTENASIILETGTRYPPDFSLFMDEDQVIVDDILEGGDTDFFTDSASQADYFSLVNEIRKRNRV